MGYVDLSWVERQLQSGGADNRLARTDSSVKEDDFDDKVLSMEKLT